MATPAALRVTETHARAYRRTWRGSIFRTFLSPVLYLTAMGLGLGALVDQGTGTATLGDISYVSFLAPGLLAATAMQVGAGDASYPVLAGMKWVGTYHAALSTPIRARDLVLGHLVWVTLRITLTTAIFGLVMTLLGASTPLGALRGQPSAVLTGLAFATAVTAYTALLENAYGLAALLRFAIIPMFLFSGAFFPITQLPGLIQPVAQLTPLWHGVELTRAAVLESATSWQPSLHIAYLAVWIGLGGALSIRNFRRRLAK